MKSKKETKPFEPQSVAVANLYAENQRLQRLLNANRKQVKYTQRAYEVLKLKYELLLLRTAYKETALAAPTTTAEAGV